MNFQNAPLCRVFENQVTFSCKGTYLELEETFKILKHHYYCMLIQLYCVHCVVIIDNHCMYLVASALKIGKT